MRLNSFFNLFFLEKRPFRVFLDSKVKNTQ